MQKALQVYGEVQMQAYNVGVTVIVFRLAWDGRYYSNMMNCIRNRPPAATPANLGANIIIENYLAQINSIKTKYL